MKRFVITAMALLTACQPVFASDLYTPDTPYNFTGFSIGIDGGGQFTSIAFDDGPFAFDGVAADGLIGGGHVDALFAYEKLRLGGYCEGGFSDAAMSISGIDLIRQEHYYGCGLKAGIMLTDATLAYGRAGYDVSHWSSDLTPISADVGSWLLGGGIESMCGEHISCGLGADYLMADTVDVSHGIGDVSKFLNESETLRAKARISYHF